LPYSQHRPSRKEYKGKTKTDNVVKTHSQSDTDRLGEQQIDASSVTVVDMRQGSNTYTQRTPEQEAEVVIVEVKRELRGLFVKSDELIKRLGNALKEIVKRERDICEEIKTALKEEIAAGIISTRTIELHCRPEWRREWKRKTKSESEKNSLSRPHSMAVVKTQDGKSVTETEMKVGNGLDMSPPQYEQGAETGISTPCVDTPTSKPTPAEVAQQEETSAQPDPSIGSVGQPICEHCPTKDAKIMELEEALKNLKAINSAVNDEVASPNKQNEDLTDTKEVFVSHIPMHFEHLRKDMETVSEITKRVGRKRDVFWKIWVDLRTHVTKIEFCGITQQKDAAMVSTGNGVLKEAS